MYIFQYLQTRVSIKNLTGLNNEYQLQIISTGEPVNMGQMSDTLGQIIFLFVYFKNYYKSAEPCNIISFRYLLGQHLRLIESLLFPQT